MSYYLFWPDADKLKACGFGSVKDVPAVFNSKWKYMPTASRYLREKAKLDMPEGLPRNRYPSPRTLDTFGQSLCNFLEWCEARQVDWTTAAYTPHLIDGYQSDMLSGIWARDRRPLAAATVNLRVTVAAEYLKWAALRELRGPFTVPSVLRRFQTGSHLITRRNLQIAARAGAVRSDPKMLRIPTDVELRLWKAEVAARSGSTKALMVDVVLATGVRREEVSQWQTDTLPLEREAWMVRGGYVTVLLTHGIKGAKHRGVNGLLMGPPRHIDLPLSLAIRLAEYREFVRPQLMRNFVKSAETTKGRRERMAHANNRLFLSDYSGAPISAQSIYRAWTRTTLPYPGWSIHCGRHYYACKTLIDRAGSAWRFAGNHQGLVASVKDIIALVIQPQLGHVDAATTQIYLTWIERMFVSTDLYEAYAESLDAIAGKSNGPI